MSSSSASSDAAAPASATAAANRGVSSYKQLTGELEATQKKLKSVIALAEKAKATHAQVLADTIERMKKENIAEWERMEEERAQRMRDEEAAMAAQKAADAEAQAREMEATIQKRVNEIVAKTTTVYELKFNELRSDMMLSQRQYDDLNEKHRDLLEWQKAMTQNEHNWQDMKKSMQAEIDVGRRAQANLGRYKTILKFMTIHKFVKDAKLKKRLLPLHTGCSKLIALILKDDHLRNRLINQQAEIARWVSDAHAIEKSEGITSELPNIGSAAGNLQGTSALVLNSATQKRFMLNTNIEYLVASLIEVEHVLATCVATVLRYNEHHSTAAAGFFERNSHLTAYAMAVEQECRDTKDRAARTQSQLSSTLALLSRLEVKYSQISRKLGKEDRTLAQRYLQRHGITTTSSTSGFEERLATASNGAATASNGTAITPSGSVDFSDYSTQKAREDRLEARKSLMTDGLANGGAFKSKEDGAELKEDSSTPPPSKDDTPDLSVLSPRALLRKLYPASPSAISSGTGTAAANRRRRLTGLGETGSGGDTEGEGLSPERIRRRTSVEGAASGEETTSTPAAATNTVKKKRRSPRPGTGGTWRPAESSTSLKRSQSNERPSSSPSSVPRTSAGQTTTGVSNVAGAKVASHHVPSAASASMAYSSSAFSSGHNLATALPIAPARPRHVQASSSSRPATVRKPKRKEQKGVDVYESSSDEEFTVKPVSYTPPPSSAAIRAFDYEEGDRTVKVDGVPVEIDVPTIADAIRKEKRRGKPKKNGGRKRKEEEKEPTGSGATITAAPAAASVELSPSDSPFVSPTATPLPQSRESGSLDAEEKESHQQPLSTASSHTKLTNADLIPSASTTAWAQKLEAKKDEREHRKEPGGGEGLPAVSSKQRLAEASPYQESVAFGNSSRASSTGSIHAVPAHPKRPSVSKETPAYAHPIGSQRSRASDVPPPRPSTGNRTAPGKFKPTPPSSRPRTSTNAGPAPPAAPVLHVLNAGAQHVSGHAVLSPLRVNPSAASSKKNTEHVSPRVGAVRSSSLRNDKLMAELSRQASRDSPRSKNASTHSRPSSRAAQGPHARQASIPVATTAAAEEDVVAQNYTESEFDSSDSDVETLNVHTKRVSAQYDADADAFISEPQPVEVKAAAAAEEEYAGEDFE